VKTTEIIYSVSLTTPSTSSEC